MIVRAVAAMMRVMVPQNNSLNDLDLSIRSLVVTFCIGFNYRIIIKDKELI